MGIITRVLEEKMGIAKKLEEILGKSSIDKALSDSHSYRKPRPCGITIHTGIGCSYRCSYCYIYDMGFSATVKPYPLNDLEIVYALARNPYVVPGYTLAAYGSVTEPFLNETRDLALKYIESVYRWLRLMSQISTKSILDFEIIRRIKLVEPNISILITIVTIDRYKDLEPYAPNPIDRIRYAAEASRQGLHISLFIRPIIPTVTDREINTILKIAIENNINNIVLGSLRVTQSIIDRLWVRGIDIDEILRRMPRKPTRRNEQIAIESRDLKERIEKIALDLGFKVYPSACSANIHSHKSYCNACRYGPCGYSESVVKIYEDDIRDFLEYKGIKVKYIDVSERRIEIVLKYSRKKDIENIQSIIRDIAKREVIIR